MGDITLDTVCTLPASTGITITVYEDSNGNGSSNNSDSQAIATGTQQYTLSGFDLTDGSQYWFDAALTSSDEEATPTLTSVALTMTLVAGSTGTAAFSKWYLLKNRR